MNSTSSMLSQRYRKVELLNEGVTSNIYSCMDRLYPESLLVVKEMKEHFKSEGCFHREVKNLSILNHKNIIKLKYYTPLYNLQREDGMKMMFPKMDCDLFTYITTGNISLVLGLYIFNEVCFAVQHCHSKRIAHLDIKPENIFLSGSKTNLNVILGDFGGSASWSDDDPLVSYWMCSHRYCAPEVLESDKFRGDKADLWSMGVLLHIILTGHYPYHGIDFVNVSLSPDIPEIIRDRVIFPLLSVNPMERPAVKVVIHILREISLSYFR